MLLNPPAGHVIRARDFLMVMGEQARLRSFEKLREADVGAAAVITWNSVL